MSPFYYIHGLPLFYPEGAFYPKETVIDEPRDLWAKEGWKASLVVGLSDRAGRICEVEDVVGHVRRIRRAQTGNPDSSFAYQRGVWRDESGAKIVIEKAVRVYVSLEEPETYADFQTDMTAIGEELLRLLAQRLIIVEFSQCGVVKEIGKVIP